MASPPKLIVLSEQLRGQSFELTEERYIIGRTEECDICVPDPTVSSHHCTLDRTETGSFTLTDQGSTNGTRLNGVRLEEGNPSQPLVNSDILQIGGVEMFYDCEDAQGSGALSTQTVINLEDSQTGVPASEMTNFDPFRRSKDGDGESKKTKIILGIVIGGLSAAVLISLVVLMFKLLAS